MDKGKKKKPAHNEETQEPAKKKGRPRSPYNGDPNFPRALKNLRIGKKMKQEDVIAHAEGKMSITSYSKYENGSLYPSEEKMDIILKGLNADNQEWLAEYESTSNAPSTPPPRVTSTPSDKELEEIAAKWPQLARKDQLMFIGLFRSLTKKDQT